MKNTEELITTMKKAQNLSNTRERRGGATKQPAWWNQRIAEIRATCNSYEAHFWLNGYVNEQNCLICGDEQPEIILEQPLHPAKCTVWYGLSAGGIIGPYFVKNQAGAMLTNY
ncbi:hypothetical protein JTB14_005188 [Gonioctena quinquepunctata]|nr:hypothetical protein JTB14_005188 [Gonioctena quinquepunctata]